MYPLGGVTEIVYVPTRALVQLETVPLPVIPVFEIGKVFPKGPVTVHEPPVTFAFTLTVPYEHREN